MLFIYTQAHINNISSPSLIASHRIKIKYAIQKHKKKEQKERKKYNNNKITINKATEMFNRKTENYIHIKTIMKWICVLCVCTLSASTEKLTETHFFHYYFILFYFCSIEEKKKTHGHAQPYNTHKLNVKCYVIAATIHIVHAKRIIFYTLIRFRMTSKRFNNNNNNQIYYMCAFCTVHTYVCRVL